MISNDDGVESQGINILYEYLSENYEVFVIAPEKEMSGSGSSITTKTVSYTHLTLPTNREV